MSVSENLVRTLRMRLLFSISWTSGAFLTSAAAGDAGGEVASSSLDSSPTLRMIVPASSERGLASSRTT
jgi:hypothetical protein